MRAWIDLFENTAFPETVTAMDLIRWVEQNHHSPEDLDTGNIADRIEQFERYKLERIPLSSLNPDEWYVDHKHAVPYMLTQRQESEFPPIIYDPVDKSIIDGIHRVNAAIKHGDTDILAYIGDASTYNRYVPEDDDEWHPDNGEYEYRIDETLEPQAGPMTFWQEGRTFGWDFAANGRKFEVKFEDEGDGEYYMCFTGADEHGRQVADLLNINLPFRVFSYVVLAMGKVIRERDPDMIFFNVDQRERKRVRTYDAMLTAAEKRGIIPDGYVWDRTANDTFMIFKDGYR